MVAFCKIFKLSVPRAYGLNQTYQDDSAYHQQTPASSYGTQYQRQQSSTFVSQQQPTTSVPAPPAHVRPALDAFNIASQHNIEVSRKIKRLTQLSKDKKRLGSNVDLAKHLHTFKSELAHKHVGEESWKDIFSFVVETMESAVKSWHQTSNVDARVYYLFDKEKTDTEKYAPVVNIDKAFESLHTHGDCVSYLRQYVVDSISRAVCLVAPKNIISYPQVWKTQGPRKWKHERSDGFFVQFESPLLRKEWFIPSSSEKGQIFCRDPVALDISAHEVIPKIFTDT